MGRPRLSDCIAALHAVGGAGVEEVAALSSVQHLEDEQVQRLTLLAAENRITLAFKEAIQRVLQKKTEIARIEADSAAHKSQMDAIEKDQGRLRENMKALKGSAEERALILRYTRELDSQEDRLVSLRKEKIDLDGKAEQGQKELQAIADQIALDERF